MKIYKFLILMGSLLTVFGSCTDLEDIAEDGISTNGPLERGALDPVLTLQESYNELNGLSDQGNWYTLNEHPTDEMIGPTRGTDWSDFGVFRQMHTHTWDASHQHIYDTWNNLNRAALRCTQTIELTDDVSIKAQASFLRAFFTFYLVDFWGQVPVRDLENPEEIPQVLNRVEGVNFIISDLEYAIANLPSVTVVGPGKASREAAQFLMAKMMLNKAVYTTAGDPSGPYTFAAADMDAVIANVDALAPSFSLEPLGEYWDSFIAANSAESNELVFVVENEAGANQRANVQNRYMMTLHYNTVPSGWNGFATVAEFYEKFDDPNDIRKGASIPGVSDVIGIRAGFLDEQQYTKVDENGDPLPGATALTDRGGNPLIFTKEVDLLYSNERNGIRVIKYVPQPKIGGDGSVSVPDNPGTDYIFFRYADAVLMKAEALLRKGDAGAALNIVNDLRATRGAAPLGALTEQDMLDERGFELYWEGWRRNDQIRFGTFLGTWDQKPNPSPSGAVLFPIPQRAIDTNPNLKQNSGYQGAG